MTTAGVTNAVALALSVITKVGDTIAVESPVYFGMLQLANSMGLRILELPTNPVTGIDPDALKKVLPQIKACLLISNFNNPLGRDVYKRQTCVYLMYLYWLSFCIEASLALYLTAEYLFVICLLYTSPDFADSLPV